MSKRNNSDLFFLCSLIEQLGRDLKLERGKVVDQLGEKRLNTIYSHADVFHCEPIIKVSDDIITQFGLTAGTFDNIAAAKYTVPDVWTMGKVYARLIEDISDEDNIIQTLIEVYTSWLDPLISNLNSSLYYQSRDYLAECYRQGEILDG